MSVSGPEELALQAAEVARSGGETEAIIEAAGGDRAALESARDRVAAMVRRRVDDFESTAALRLLNRALSESPPADPFDWQVRWERHRKP
ncbi:MAG TPA: hypothetical protein VNF71_12650 [Acidimicrobiales bacterium]|nr:hypothetical protein [Acidimicrobiales bacterium]